MIWGFVTLGLGFLILIGYSAVKRTGIVTEEPEGLSVCDPAGDEDEDG